MYRLTPNMEQALRKSLEEYHRLFHNLRCSGEQLEALIFKAIQLDSEAGHQASWQAGAHDTEADIRVRVNGELYPLQIKSGTVTRNGYLRLSGSRLTRFRENFGAITEYLNSSGSDILSVSYRQENNRTGRYHIYRIRYVDREYLHQLSEDAWVQSGQSWKQTNQYGVNFTLSPSMSWQIWWELPLDLLDESPEFTIG